jgi:hypothetical protein
LQDLVHAANARNAWENMCHAALMLVSAGGATGIFRNDQIKT